MLFEYILNGKSFMYLKGSTYAIFCKNNGKNGIGTVLPENISASVEKIFIIPFSFYKLSEIT